MRKVLDSVTEVVMTVVIRRDRLVVLLNIGSHPIFIPWRRYAVMILHGCGLTVSRRCIHPICAPPWNSAVYTGVIPAGGG